jgi:dTDP-glucose 4,6-dehydratase
MKNLLITGGAGFIGTNFVKIMNKYKKDVNCIIVDKLSYASKYENIKNYIDGKNFFFYEDDITNYKNLNIIFQKHNIDSLINFAAESHVDNSIDKPIDFINSNIFGTYNLLKISLDHWKNSLKENIFFQISTDEVFGSLSSNESSNKETSKYDPKNPYSASKASSDMLIRAFSNTYDLNYIITHSCNNYGNYQNTEKFIPLIIQNILKGLPLPIYGDGRNIREWIHVDDNCKAIIELLFKGSRNNSYNISSDFEISNIDLALLICKKMDEFLLQNTHLNNIYPKTPIFNNNKSSKLIEYVEDRKGHDFKYSLDCKKLKDEINFRCDVEFEDGLKKTIRWYIANYNWWI